MSDPREPNADDVESILGRFQQSNLEQLHAAGVDVDQVDFERLHELIRQAVGSHPDRDEIIDLMRQAMYLFIVPRAISSSCASATSTTPRSTPRRRRWSVPDARLAGGGGRDAPAAGMNEI